MNKSLGPRRTRSRKPDYLLMFCTFLLVLFGLFMLSSASSYLSKARFNNSYYYLQHQLLYGALPGLIGFFAASKIYYGWYRKISIPLLLAAMVLLVLVFTPLGVSVSGAERWIRLGPITFQPSEILKIPFIIYLAAWLGNSTERQRKFWSGFVPFIIIVGVIAGLLLKQPATSVTVILLSAALIVYFVSGARLSYILSAIVAALVLLGMVIYFTPYRLARVKTFFAPETNLQSTGYHVNQTKIAIGFGGLTGVGYGQSTSKVNYLPEPIGDSIFAVIAEELGFIGAISLLAVIFLLVMRMLLLAVRCPDRFGQLLLVGFGSLIALQSFVNIGAISGVLPLTGAPLPFISYGGTALAIFMTISGIAVNISKYS